MKKTARSAISHALLVLTQLLKAALHAELTTTVSLLTARHPATRKDIPMSMALALIVTYHVTNAEGLATAIA